MSTSTITPFVVLLFLTLAMMISFTSTAAASPFLPESSHREEPTHSTDNNSENTGYLDFTPKDSTSPVEVPAPDDNGYIKLFSGTIITTHQVSQNSTAVKSKTYTTSTYYYKTKPYWSYVILFAIFISCCFCCNCGKPSRQRQSQQRNPTSPAVASVIPVPRFPAEPQIPV